jgi:hypothetical protein
MVGSILDRRVCAGTLPSAADSAILGARRVTMRIRLPLFAALLAACAVSACTTTYPAQLLLDPARFENDALRVEWAIGINFFRLKITNLSEAQVDLDLASSSVISVDGQAQLLLAPGAREVRVIPPRSYIILSGEQGAIFGADILGRFNAESEQRYPLPADLNGEDRTFLKGHTGETVRLYLAADVRGKRIAYDIPFKIAGASRVQTSGGDQKPAAQSAPASQPGIAPAGGAQSGAPGGPARK